MWSLFVDVEWSLQHPIFCLINEWRSMIISYYSRASISPSKSCPSLPGWSNALSRYSLSLSPVLESHLTIYKIYPCWCEEHDLARIFFCDVRYGLWFLSSNEFWYRFSRDAQWLDGQYLHTLVPLSEDWLVVQKQFIQPPDILKASFSSFFSPCFGVVVWYIYIYRSCHGDRGLPGTRYITSIIILRSGICWREGSGWGA